MNLSQKTPAEDPLQQGISPATAAIATGIQEKPLGTSRQPRLSRFSVPEMEKELHAFGKMHEWDPNLQESKREAIEHAENIHDIDAEVALALELEEDSPYPEVVAAVPNTDDVEEYASTFRAWFLGMIFVTIGSALNLLFSLRQPTIQITSIVAQLLSYPIGVFMAKVLPTRVFTIFGYKFSLNPGPFKKKEHTIITIMANVTFAQGAAYSTFTIEAMRGFYKINWGFGFAIMFTLCTQLIGLGIAGMTRRFLVYPAAMIWPGNLPNCALFTTLHNDIKENNPKETNGWKIGRYRFFMYVLIGSYIWYWFPGFIWQGLSAFAWVTWLKPNDAVINQVMGTTSGLSIGAPFTAFTLDWTTVSAWLLSPLMAPWHAISNTLIGVILFSWIISAAISFSGSWYSDYLPMSDSSSYDNTQHAYNVRKILNPDFTLDLQKYKEYSPIFLSTTFALQYGLSFATIVAIVFHTALFHGKELWYRAKAARNQEDDIHMKLMKLYPEAPDWWFLVMFFAMVGVGFATVFAYDTKLSAGAYILSLFLAICWIIPIGMIQAITNISIGLNVFSELVISYMSPGRPIAMMSFKTFSTITLSQGVVYAQDLKLGHYMKVPPRALFWAQGIASIWACFVQVVVLQWAFASIDGICTPDQPSKFTCPNGKVFFNASIIWGVIGPQRMFSAKGIYGSLQWFWLIGAVTPVLFYLLARRYPRGPWRYVNMPVIFGGQSSLPPAVPMNYIMWGTIGYIFNRHIRSRYRGWWITYNYILSAALDSGLAIATILIFFVFTMTKTDPPKWWGNNVVNTTLDYNGNAVRKTVTDGEIFGPPKGGW